MKEPWELALAERAIAQDPIRGTMAKLEEAGLLDLTIRCAEVHGVTPRFMLSGSRTRAPARARAMLWACMRAIDTLRWSYPEIGHVFNRDHTTVMAQARRIPDDEVTALVLEHDDVLDEREARRRRAAELRRARQAADEGVAA